MRLILASGSPRRRELLARLGLPFEVIVSGIEEEVPPEASPREAVEALALEKALAVSRHHPDALVLGADTDIDLDGRILGKPEDDEDARRMLWELRGRSHRVWTGLALVHATDGRREVASLATRVHMRQSSDAEIERYVRSGEPLDKAGAYAIQQRGGALVRRIKGCYNNVVGLPLCEVASLLTRCSLSAPASACVSPEGLLCPRA